MFLAHYGVAFAAKRASPRTSLGVLVLAAQWLDLLWPIFVLLGWEKVRIAPGDTRLTPPGLRALPLDALAGRGGGLGGPVGRGCGVPGRPARRSSRNATTPPNRTAQ